AAFAALLTCIAGTPTTLVHLGVDLAESICRLLQTATNQDGTLTVASAAAFIVLLSKMAGNDRRGNIRASLQPALLLKVTRALQIVLDTPTLEPPPQSTTSIPLTPVRNIRSIPKKTFLQIVHSPSSAQESVRRATQIVNPASLAASIKVQQRNRRSSSAMFNPRRQTSSDLGDITADRTASLASLSDSCTPPSSAGRSSSLLSPSSIEPVTRIWSSILDECGSSADRLRTYPRIQQLVLQSGIPDVLRAQ
ncbi:hypothetical protein BVRB_020150, partial [Beta vulgaris subsp. vulgaris]